MLKGKIKVDKWAKENSVVGSELRLSAFEFQFQNELIGNSLAVQWLGLLASTAGGLGLIPGRGTKIPQAARCGQKKKKQKTIDLGWVI